MAPRLASRPARDNDFSNVGKVGRRTGVTLPQGRLDVNGMEEISGIFSSPRKPSPLRKSMSVMESVEERADGITPKQTRSSRKSLPPPRSASPRKSGISGTAKRSKVVDILNQKLPEVVNGDLVDEENSIVATPTLLAAGAKRFSPEKTPLKDVTGSRQQSARSTRLNPTPKFVEDSIHDSIEPVEDLGEDVEVLTEVSVVQPDPMIDEYMAPAVDDDDDDVSIVASLPDGLEEPPLPAQFDDEEADETFKPETRSKIKPKEPTVANSRRKRKSDALEVEAEVDMISSPAAKRAKRISDQNSEAEPKRKSPVASPAQAPARKSRNRAPLKKKDPNLKITAQQENELNKIVEKVKARPGQKKSLYILRRETPAEDGVAHTRSGRISVKPLAYWRNERCVFGGSPGGASLQDGARFPLNSIKEIIRTEEVAAKDVQNLKKGRKGKSKAASRHPSTPAEGIQDQEESEPEDDEVRDDEDQDGSDAEPWEKERGIFRGPIAVWNQQQQSPTDGEEEMDIAYAPASIELREVKGSTFRYAKMLSMKFFGSGIVDLPPGSIKKSKNSRRMHMSFFVATGRVTVQVSPLGGPENKFSIGKGGWWQVPRGNQYSIANDLQNPAKVFFSQACEPAPQGYDD